MAFQCDRRLFLNRDKSRVVEDGDKDAGFLFASRGGEISAPDAAAFGLEWVDGKIILPAATAAEAKAKKKPEDKAAKKGADKATGRPPDSKP